MCLSNFDDRLGNGKQITLDVKAFISLNVMNALLSEPGGGNVEKHLIVLSVSQLLIIKGKGYTNMFFLQMYSFRVVHFLGACIAFVPVACNP